MHYGKNKNHWVFLKKYNFSTPEALDQFAFFRFPVSFILCLLHCLIPLWHCCTSSQMLYFLSLKMTFQLPAALWHTPQPTWRSLSLRGYCILFILTAILKSCVYECACQLEADKQRETLLMLKSAVGGIHHFLPATGGNPKVDCRSAGCRTSRTIMFELPPKVLVTLLKLCSWGRASLC